MKLVEGQLAARVAKGTVALSIGNVVNSLMGLATTVLILKLLPPDQYGLVAIALTIIGLLSTLLIFGIDQTLVKFISENIASGNFAKNKSLLVASLKVTFLVGIVSCVALPLIAEPLSFYLHTPGVSVFIKIASFGVVASLIGGIFLSIFQGFQKFSYMVLFQLAGSVFTLIFIFTFVWLGYGAIGILTGIVVANFLGCFLGLILFLHIYKLFRKYEILSRGTVETFRELFSFGKFILLTNIIKPMIYRLEIFILAFFKGAEELGYYYAAFNLTDIVLIWFTAGMSTTLYPILSESFTLKKLDTFRQIIERTVKYMAYISIPTCVGLLLLARPLLYILASKEYLAATLVFQILVFRIAISCIGAVSAPTALLAMGKPDVRLKIIALQLPLDFFLAMILVPRFGAIGTAITTLIVTSIAFILAFLVIYKTVSFHIHLNGLMKSSCAAIVMGLVIFPATLLLPNNSLKILAGVGMGTFVYTLILVLWGGFDKQDLILLRNLMPNRYYQSILNFLDRFAKE